MNSNYEKQKKLKHFNKLSKSFKASYLVANWIAKTKKPITIAEELIMPAALDICREVLEKVQLTK